MRFLLPVALAALLAGCSGAGKWENGIGAASKKGATLVKSRWAIAKVPEPAEIARSSRCVSGTARRLGSSTETYAALASGTTVVYARPGGPRLRTFGPRNVNGYPTVFAVAGQVLDETCAPSWYRVQIPVATERDDRVRARRLRRDRRCQGEDRGRPVRAAGRALPKRQSCHAASDGDRLAGDTDAHRSLLREPAAHRHRPVRTLRPGGAGISAFSPCLPTGRRAARSRFTVQMTRARSEGRSRTGVSASRTAPCFACSSSRRRGRLS